MSTRSMASRRRWPSARRTLPGIRDPPSPPRPSASISCACSSRAWGRRPARTAEPACARTPWMKWPGACSPCPQARAGMRSLPVASTRLRRRCAIISSNCAKRASTGCFSPVGSSNSPLRNRCSISIFPSPCSRWSIAWPSVPVFTSGWWTPSKSATAKPAK